MRTSEAIFGYNILAFDIPFIWTRLSLLSKVDADLYHSFFNRNLKDIYQYFGESYHSIDHWLERFNIKRRCGYTGKDVPQLFRDDKYEDIEAHAIDDLIVSEKLVTKLRSRARLRESLELHQNNEQGKHSRTTIHKQNRRNPTARGREGFQNTIRTVKEPEIAGIHRAKRGNM